MELKGIDWSWLIVLTIAGLGALILALVWDIAMLGALAGFAALVILEIYESKKRRD